MIKCSLYGKASEGMVKTTINNASNEKSLEKLLGECKSHVKETSFLAPSIHPSMQSFSFHIMPDVVLCIKDMKMIKIWCVPQRDI